MRGFTTGVWSWDQVLPVVAGTLFVGELAFIGGLLVTFGSSGPGGFQVDSLFYAGISMFCLGGLFLVVVIVYGCFTAC